MSTNSNSNSKYDIRAPPRRRAKKDEQEDQPIFLRKAYAMINSCPPEIGGWSEKGDTVVIKDVKAFSDKVIPTAYKHNNFSSFVRQLNFYGFRKVKSESLQNPNWWEFRHASFVRGKPQLLSEIKRSMHFVAETGSVKEITELKCQVASLTEKLNALNDQVEFLTGAFSSVQIKSPAPQIKLEKNKKRKVSSVESSSAIELKRMTSLGSTGMVDEFRSSGAELPAGNEFQNFDWNEEMEIQNETEEEGDAELFNEIVEDLVDLEEQGPEVQQMPQMNEQHHLPQDDEMSRVSDLSDVTSVIDKLPADLQLRFVDKLAEVVGCQLASAVNTHSLPVVNAEPVPDNLHQYLTSYPELMLPSGKAPEIALPLAQATLSAFLLSNLKNLTHPSVLSSIAVQNQLGAK